MRPEITIIICAFNEINRIEKAYTNVLDSLKGRTELVEMLILDNGSTDGTREWLENLNDTKAKVVFNKTNLGKGGSVKKGIKLSAGRYIVIYDADCEYNAKDIWKCYDHAINTGSQFVMGSRVLAGYIRHHRLINYIGVRFLTVVINILYGCKLTDSATGMKLIEGNMLRKVNLECNGFDLDFELITRIARIGGKIAEIPGEYYPRTTAEGKKIRAFHDGMMALKVILRDRFISEKSILINS